MDPAPAATLYEHDIAETLPAAPEPAFRRTSLDPTKIFVDKDRTALLWFLVAVVGVGVAVAEPFFLVPVLKARERVVVIDPSNTYFVSPTLEFEEASALHTAQARLAAVAFLERNPESFDNKELLQRLFGKTALQAAYQQQTKGQEESRAKQIHQKPEVSEVTILETRSDFVLCRVRGQLVRAGIFNDRPFTEALPFTLSLKMLRNPDMLSNARFPTVVSAFRYDEK